MGGGGENFLAPEGKRVSRYCTLYSVQCSMYTVQWFDTEAGTGTPKLKILFRRPSRIGPADPYPGGSIL